MARESGFIRKCRSISCRLRFSEERRPAAVNVVDDWFRKSIASEMESVLTDDNSLIYEYLRPLAVSKLLKKHKSGACDNHKILFSLVVLEHSLRNYGV